MEGQCFIDNDGENRHLPFEMITDSKMTVEKCKSHCFEKQYNFAGVKDEKKCFCGKTRPPIPASLQDCNMSCAGDKTQLCGGSNRFNVYENI